MIAALVMAAGRSQRFGSDKRVYQLPNGRRMLAQSIINALTANCYAKIFIVLPQHDRELFASIVEEVAQTIKAAGALTATQAITPAELNASADEQASFLNAKPVEDLIQPIFLSEQKLFGDNLAAAFKYLLAIEQETEQVQKKEKGLGNNCEQQLSHCAVLLADMPFIRPATHAQLCQQVLVNNYPVARPALMNNKTLGHPVFFHKQFWSELAQLSGEQGGKEIIARVGCEKIIVQDDGVVRDLDSLNEM